MRVNNRSIFKPRASAVPKIKAKDDETVLYIYDEISWFGISADEFVKNLNSIEDKTIHVRINSPGGAVFDGLAIYNALKQHPSNIIVHIDGLAASIASLIALGGNEIRAAEASFLMIHEPWSIVIGPSEEMRKEADLLDKVAGVLVKAYLDKTGMTEEVLNDYLAAETWFTAQEALDVGFVDVIEELDDSSKAKATAFDLSAFANVPDSLTGGKTPPTERELEGILRDAGFSRKQSEEILAKGYADGQGDPEPEDISSPDGDGQGDPDLSAQGDPEPPPELRTDPISDLLTRAEIAAPSP